jgi:hypothetical protein
MCLPTPEEIAAECEKIKSERLSEMAGTGTGGLGRPQELKAVRSHGPRISPPKVMDLFKA